MSAGKKALREAARLESARVYGSVQREHVNHIDHKPVDKSVDTPESPDSVGESGSEGGTRKKSVDPDRVVELRKRYYERTG